jgi:KRAB domain-containing zinc finger protein
VSEDLLKKHISEYHQRSKAAKQGESHDCSVCGQKFKVVWDLKVHMYRHTGKYPFKCEVCDRGFARKNTLKEHLETHKMVRPHRCDYCDKSFASKYALKDHIKTHTDGEHAYCKICDKSFSNSSGIRYHMKLHENDKRFVCEFCGKSYVNKQELFTHRMGHTGERPFKCPGCEAGFRRQACVNRHVDKQKTLEKFICEECNETFELRCAAKKHMEKHQNQGLGTKANKKKQERFTLKPIEDWPIICPGCDIGFLNEFGLDRHVESQRRQGSFNCRNCDEIFELNCAFKKHCEEKHPSTSSVVEMEMKDYVSGTESSDEDKGLGQEEGAIVEGPVTAEITTVPHALFETSSELFLVLK